MVLFWLLSSRSKDFNTQWNTYEGIKNYQVQIKTFWLKFDFMVDFEIVFEVYNDYTPRIVVSTDNGVR